MLPLSSFRWQGTELVPRTSGSGVGSPGAESVTAVLPVRSLWLLWKFLRPGTALPEVQQQAVLRAQLPALPHSSPLRTLCPVLRSPEVLLCLCRMGRLSLDHGEIVNISFPVYRTCLGTAGVSFLGLPCFKIHTWGWIRHSDLPFYDTGAEVQGQVPGGYLLWLLSLAYRQPPSCYVSIPMIPALYL